MVRILEYVFWIAVVIATALFIQTYLGHGRLFESVKTNGNYREINVKDFTLNIKK